MPSVRIRVVDRVVDILSCFSAEHPEMGVLEISRKLDLDKATVCRILLTLESRGLVRANPDSRKYSIGPKVLELAQVRAENVNLPVEALPHMRWLRDQTGETVFLSVRSNYDYMYVQKVESRHEIRRTVQIGGSRPLHCAAPGNAILAHMSEDNVERYIANVNLVRYTDKTITDPCALRAALKEIRTQGYAVSYGERIPDTVSFAASVRDHTGAVVASLAVSMPSTRYTPIRKEEYAALTKAAAERLSVALVTPASKLPTVSIPNM